MRAIRCAEYFPLAAGGSGDALGDDSGANRPGWPVSALPGDSGLDLGRQDRASAIAFEWARRTFGNRAGGSGLPVLDTGGFFANLMDFAGTTIAMTSDGIGTKVELAESTGIYHTLGFDLMAMVANDLAAAGCEPVNVTNILDVDTADAVVDDSIVWGTTARLLVELLRKAGATEVYVVSAAPPIKHPCIYGIDMSARGEIIAAHNEVEDVKRYLGADAVVYQRLEDLQDLYRELPCCYACFSGGYPTGATAQILAEIEAEKISARG